MDLKNYNWSEVLSGIGKVATVFNPAIGGSLIVASEVVSKLDSDSILSNNDILENDVIGLTRSAEILDSIYKKYVSDGFFDIEQLTLVTTNLRSLEQMMTKTSLILK